MIDSSTHKKIRVLIVEDSPLIRKVLNNILSTDDRFEVIAQAINGEQAVRYTKLFKPDVISMDMFMPVMDGLEATYEIMRNHPVPIVIVSSLYKENEVSMAIQELNAGAVAVFPKPLGPEHPDYKHSVIKYKNLLKLMSEIKVVTRTAGVKSSYNAKPAIEKKPSNTNNCVIPSSVSIVAIGASAGGPEAIRILLESLSYPIKAPVIIIQHIDSNFTDGFATWLQQFSKCSVKIAKSGEQLENNTIYIAPGGKHLTITKDSNIKLTVPIKRANGTGHVPSIDIFFNSLVDEMAGRSIAILLSGMGRDGADGLKRLKETGSFTLIQNQESSLIYGMPGEAEKINAECSKLSPYEIAAKVNYILNQVK